MELTKITTGMEKGPEAIQGNFAYLDPITAVQVQKRTTGAATLLNGAIGDVSTTIQQFGKLRIITIDGGMKGIDIHGSGAVGFGKVKDMSLFANAKFIAAVGNRHHNGMGGVVDISINTDSGDLGVTALTTGEMGLSKDLIWSAGVTVLMEVN